MHDAIQIKHGVLLLQQHLRGSVADAFTSTVRMVFDSTITLMFFVFVILVVVACFMGPAFLYIFQKFLNFCVQIYSLGLGFTFGVKV